jgi:hypothetical protein
VTDIVELKGENSREQRGDDIEQPAVEIKIIEVEKRLVAETAAVVGDDEFAVPVLHGFIVGYRVVTEGQKNEDGQRQQQQRPGEIETINSRYGANKAAEPYGWAQVHTN